jgi:hypothetical protein
MKKSHMILGAIGVGAIGYIVYKKFMSPENTNFSPYSYPNDAYNSLTGAQPSEQYPWNAIQPPRVDNSNQPWYGGSRQLASPASSKPSSSIPAALSDVQNASAVVGSLSSIWDDLGVGDMFSNGGDSGEVDDDSGSFSWNSLFN